MFRLWALLCLASACASGYQSTPAPSEIFVRTRENVIRHLKQSTNYTCTEVLDRNFYYVPASKVSGCPARGDNTAGKLYMHDRLRLDVAVSDGGEIFSWHGGEKFSTAGIESIVQTGAVSSGSFIGYLSNIFTRTGISVTYAGHVVSPGASSFRFSYDVPRASSSYHVQVGKGKVLAPFHGSFSVDDHTFELTDLDVVMDQTPKNSDICMAAMNIHYQTAKISGEDSLIARDYLLRLNLTGQRSTENRTSFTDCHAFQGESVIHYTDLDETQALKSNIGPVRSLPEGLRIHAALTTPITDQNTYAGDPVEATLLSPLRLSKLNLDLPKGSRLKGVISRLEYHVDPASHYLLSIILNSISNGATTYRLNALLQTPFVSKLELADLYKVPENKLPPDDPATGGELLYLGKSFHTPRNVSAVWITTRISGE